MKLFLEGNAKEIAGLVLELQNQRVDEACMESTVRVLDAIHQHPLPDTSVRTPE